MRRRLAEHGIDRTLLLLLPAVAFLVVVFLYPFGYGLVLSFQPERYVGTFANYQQFFADPFLRDTITITLGLAVPAALLNVIASVPIAYRMRGAFRGKRLLIGMLVMPVTLGT
ncbi:MAG: putative spermidine/putrescine transport system permease protein, partial [Solirubrobacteraceae bacterium]|nr:putative spermidine/putrescine transport system permease protein [Solirubrobacteraceae bacterium]